MFVLISFFLLTGLMPSIVSSYPIYLAERDANPPTKFVVAHHMVGNTYPYVLQDWLDDISQAHASGIDAFVLNIGSDPWQSARVADAYTAAQQSNTGFKLFISFDMTVLPCASSSDAGAIRQYITTYANHPAQFIYNGKPFASTFSGSSCAFGTGSVATGWQSVFAGTPVQFVPSFFMDPTQFSTLGNIMNGALNWNGAWPISLTAASIGQSMFGLMQSIVPSLPSSILSTLGSLETDDQYLAGLGLPTTKVATNVSSSHVSPSLSKRSDGNVYMATVSPWFFTHYGPDTYNKNWIYLGDDHLYARRWENLIAARDSIDIVQVLTWNDFGESHYVGPVRAHSAQPKSEAWVDGYDHQGWLPLTSYYAAAFKSGSYPAITKDQVVMWARPHSKNAVATGDNAPKPTNWQLTSDTLWAIALLTSPATVTLSSSPSNSQSFSLPAGVSKISIPLQPGGNLHAVVSRPGQNNTVDIQSSGYTYQEGTVPTYNFNAFVVASE